jgi:hypothetical protein
MIAKLALFLFWAWTLICVGWVGLMFWTTREVNEKSLSDLAQRHQRGEVTAQVVYEQIQVQQGASVIANGGNCLLTGSVWAGPAAVLIIIYLLARPKTVVVVERSPRSGRTKT